MQGDVAQLLEQLRDIHAPPPVSFWPPAVGWWILLLLLLALIGFGVWFLRRRKPRYKELLVAELQKVQVEYAVNKNGVWLLQQLSILMRRSVKLLHPQHDALARAGDAWLRCLDQLGQTTQFSQGVGQVLATGPYQRNVDYNADELIRLVRDWIAKQP